MLTRKHIVTLLALVGLLILVNVAFAQTNEPLTGAAQETADSPNSIDALIALLTTALIVPIAAPVVTLVVNGLKLLIPLPAGVLALVVTGVVWLVWYASNAFGYGDLFNALVPQLETIIRVVLAIAGIVLTTGNASSVFAWSVNNRVPLLSYQRTP